MKHASDADPAVSYLFADWPDKPDNIRALTTLRAGGYSAGDYHSFNLATHVGDTAEAVSKNRDKLSRDLELPCPPFWLNQVHSNRVIAIDHADSPGQGPVDADASFSRRPGGVCAVMTADCLPVFFTSKAGDEVAIAHAGWRGLHAGIISATVAAMHTPAEHLSVYLGPAIGPDAFEVGEEVYQAFCAREANNTSAFSHSQRRAGKQHFLCDIYQLARLECDRLGVNTVAGGNLCTFSDAERFYSFRRDKLTGRMASLIWIA